MTANVPAAHGQDSSLADVSQSIAERAVALVDRVPLPLTEIEPIQSDLDKAFAGKAD
jgi:hypothetical protein